MDLELYHADRISRFVEGQENELRRQYRELRRIDRLEHALTRARRRLPVEIAAPSWSYQRSPGAR